jgi:glycosyltransferase involved in cell wall biosynthesis
VKKKQTWYIYAEAIGHSGQFEATRILIEDRVSRGHAIEEVVFPALCRTSSRGRSFCVYCLRLLIAWCKCLPILWRPLESVHFNIGQTATSVFRDLVVVLLCRVSSPRVLGIALHGNSFGEWKTQSFIRSIFVYILNSATTVTVLSKNQLNVLRGFGVTSPIRIVPNACNALHQSVEAIVSKHSVKDKIAVLHLSSLIDTKGFPEFVESIAVLNKMGSSRVTAVLCGSYVGSKYAKRFHSKRETEAWLKGAISEINKNAISTLKWVDGAYGEAKWDLFRSSQIFVFPSTYSVEAQPVVLLEAIANGLVCISTDTGDIGTIFPPGGYCRLDCCSKIPLAEQIALHIDALSKNQELRTSIALSGLRRFNEIFSKSAYVAAWDDILGGNLTHAIDIKSLV